MPDATTTRTLAEILAELNALPPEQHRDAVAALQNDAGPVVKQFRSKVFASGKSEGAKGGADAAEALERAQAEAEDLKTQLADALAKAPEAKAIEERTEARWKGKVTKAEQERDTAKTTLSQRLKDIAIKDFVAALKPGVEVSDKYASLVMAREFADRFEVTPDGQVRVLQPGSADPYEPANGLTAVELLAADAKKTVPPEFQLSNADSGAGVRGNGGALSSGRSPAKDAQAKVASGVVASF